MDMKALMSKLGALKASVREFDAPEDAVRFLNTMLAMGCTPMGSPVFAEGKWFVFFWETQK